MDIVFIILKAVFVHVEITGKFDRRKFIKKEKIHWSLQNTCFIGVCLCPELRFPSLGDCGKDSNLPTFFNS